MSRGQTFLLGLGLISVGYAMQKLAGPRPKERFGFQSFAWSRGIYSACLAYLFGGIAILMALFAGPEEFN